MIRRQAHIGALILALLICPCIVRAQEIRTVDNPYQEEIAYQVDTVLRPQVMINSLRWDLFKVEPKEGKERRRGQTVPTTVILEMENLGESNANVLAVFLLEDKAGNQLSRLECKKMKIRAGRMLEAKTKLKVDGGILNDTHKIWAYVEVTR